MNFKPDDYVRTFDTRGDSYNNASSIAPNAREEERAILIAMLRAGPDDVVCDVPSGGGYVADGIRPLLKDPRQIVCVEPSPVFAKGLDPAYRVHVGPIDRWPLADASVDRVASLAGLHHLDSKASLFHEAARALRPGGRMAVGDAMDATPVARFLNGAVDRYTTTGHDGRFLQPGELERLLKGAGFVDVVEVHRRYHWRFESAGQMARYCRALFGMVKASEDEVRFALEADFAVEKNGSGVMLPWSLSYASARKP